MRTLLALVLVGCAHAAPVPPSTTTQTEITLAETAEKARQHEVARAHYEAAIASAKDPASSAYARRAFAETLMSWGEYPAATLQLEGVVAVKPAAAGSWHDLGMLYHHAGNDAKAIAALETARSLLPADPRPRVALAALRWKRHDFAGAKAEYEALRALALPERLRVKVEWAIQELAKAAPTPVD